MNEPRKAREARLQIREAEKAVERVHMSPAVAVAPFSAGYYLRRARLALRQAERAFARVDDPGLEPMRPQLRDRRPQLEPRRKRYRCPDCFEEILSDGLPERALGPDGAYARHPLWCRRCETAMEPVARRKAKRA